MSFCPNCGSELPENTKFCPACGQMIVPAQEQAPSGFTDGGPDPAPLYQENAPTYQQVQQTSYTQGSYAGQTSYSAYQAGTSGSAVNGFGIAALVLGIASFFLDFLIFIPSILAVVFGCLGIVKGNSQGTGKGMAIAGLVLGIVAALIYIIAMVAATSLVRYAFWR